jgi:predicted nucleic-acid-binding protein
LELFLDDFEDLLILQSASCKQMNNFITNDKEVLKLGAFNKIHITSPNIID